MTGTTENQGGKVRVLYFVDRMRHGGIQTLVIEVLKHVDRAKVQIDFLLLDDGSAYELEDVLRELGSRVYKLKNIWISRPWDYFAYCRALNQFFGANGWYDAVHVHSGSKNFPVLKYAKNYGIPIRIAHSHNVDFQTESKLKKWVGDRCKPLLVRYATDFFACSEEAGRWLFGDRKVTIVKNGVDVERFSYDKRIAENVRRKYRIPEEAIVVGHVGRFTHQKNHDFLIEVFRAVYEKDKRYRLLLVGSGELEDAAREKVRRYEMEDAVIFAGYQPDASRMLQAMDLFVFPSSYEGLGIVLIEAQAAGLPCLASLDLVPAEAKVTDLLEFVPLCGNPEEWAGKIRSISVGARADMRESIAKSGYDIREIAGVLQEYYMERALQK